MNDPQVVALIYIVEHGNGVSYENVVPLRHSDSPEFDLTVEDKTARFEFNKHYADKDKAREAIEPFIQQWEFETGIRWGPNSFRLRFKKAEIIDRNPLPPEYRSGPIQVRAEVFMEGELSVNAPIIRGMPHYPPPPAGDSFALDDLDVVKMKRRYDQYLLGRATRLDVAYFCMNVLEKKYGGLPTAAKTCGISRSVLTEIKKLSSNKGGEDSRKAEGFDVELTSEEKKFLNLAIPNIILRVAQVAADGSKCHPKITKGNLLSL